MVKAYEHNAGIIRHFGKHDKKKIEGFIQDFIQDFPFGRGGGGGNGVGETNPSVKQYATGHLPRGRECPTPPLND